VKLEIKGLKTWKTDDGGGYQYTLMVDGRRAAFVHNDGNGGGSRFDTTPRVGDDKLFEQFADYVAALPLSAWDHPILGNLFDPKENRGAWYEEATPEERARHDRASKVEIYAERLVDEFEEAKQMKRWCAKKTVVRLKTHKPEQYLINPMPYTAAFAEKLRAKHGEQLVEIVNERFV
jgi:hypothetical protein